MTNNEIIYRESIAAGIFTQEQADQILASGARLPLHTFQEWKRMGFSVKKGEHAALSCTLWKFTNKPGKAGRQAAAELGEATAELLEEKGDPHYYMAKAALFTASQVKPIGQPDEGEELPF